MRKKGAIKKVHDPKCEWLTGLNDSFSVRPIYDGAGFFEINCTPYQVGNKEAIDCFKEVIGVVDSMRADKLIDYNSGHKHVDAFSATHGNIAIILKMDYEIQSNPYLLRLFGGHDRIMIKDRSWWYKTFSDYSKDTRIFAVERLNKLLRVYNDSLLIESGVGYVDGKNREEAMADIEKFACFYSFLFI